MNTAIAREGYIHIDVQVDAQVMWWLQCIHVPQEFFFPAVVRETIFSNDIHFWYIVFLKVTSANFWLFFCTKSAACYHGSPIPTVYEFVHTSLPSSSGKV